MPGQYRQRNPTVLNVAEKPSVARALAAVFARMHGSQDGGMVREGNQVFTHTNVSFPNIYSQGDGRIIHGPETPHKMITTSVRGHLASQDFPPSYGWNKCDPQELFDAPIETSYRDDMQVLAAMLRRLSNTSHAVILWLDCDREGEAIGEEVREVCCSANPILEVYRARFSTVLEAEIKRALKSLGRLNYALVQAVQARSEMDLRVGSAFTRFQTKRLQRRFDKVAEEGVVSYGPCQFPTLGFVVERWARIETFVPEDFWFLELSLRIDSDPEQQQQQQQPPSTTSSRTTRGRPTMFSWKRVRLYDQLLTLSLYESCLDAGEAVVTHVQGRPKNKWRPVPLATIELQKRASRYLRIGSETLMQAAEELYNAGYISYPRTETERFRPEFQHRPLIQQFANAANNDSNNQLASYASKLLTDNNFQTPRHGQNDDNAHPPITPCKAVDPNTISDPMQRNIYTLVVKHYFACCSRDAVGRETQLTVRLASESFGARGLMILEKNWLEIYHPWEKWSTGQGELPLLQVGSRIVPTSLLMKEGRTNAPQPISEVELISLMDRNKIGTDATIAQHITTIQEREYAIKDANQRFSPTPLGIALVEGYNSMGYQLNRPDLRRQTEEECNHVAAGRKTKEQIISPLLEKMRQCFITATRDAHKLDDAVARHFPRLGTDSNTTQTVQAVFSACGACQNFMSLKQKQNSRGNGGDHSGRATRKLVYCNTCTIGYNLPKGVLRAKTAGSNGGVPVKCSTCNFQLIRVIRGDGYEGNGYDVCPKCFSDPPPPVIAFDCPFCQQSSARNQNSNSIGKVCLRKTSTGKFVLSCNRYVPGQDSCPYSIWLPKESRVVSIPSVTGNEENENNNINNTNAICTKCSTPGHLVRKVHFVWKNGSLPPSMGRECLVCILCDADFRRDLSISLPQPGQGNTTRRRQRGVFSGSGNTRGQQGRGARRGAQQNNNAGSNQVGNACYRCGQTGHYANNCPNR